MKTKFKAELNTYCTLHWWNFGSKTLQFKGTLQEFLKEQKVTFKISKKKDSDFQFNFNFTNPYGITFKVVGMQQEFPHYAKQFLQMEMVRMGDKCTIYVQGVWRPTVTVNH